LYRKSRPDCNECLEIHNKRKDPTKRKPNCKQCGKVNLLIENVVPYHLIEKYQDIMIDGNGGISAEGIRFAFDTEDISIEERNTIVQKIITFLKTAINTVRKEET